jgi:hypothetical protein
MLTFIRPYDTYPRLRWVGHVTRRENEEIIKIIMLVKTEGKMKKGRPRMRWMDGVEK